MGEKSKQEQNDNNIDDMGEAGCIICEYCYEESNQLICEKWDKKVYSSDYCDFFIARP